MLKQRLSLVVDSLFIAYGIESPLHFLEIVNLDEKRLHLYTRLCDAGSGEVRASSEQVFLHMDTEARKVAPIKPEMMRALEAIYAVHSALPAPPDLGRRTGEKR